MVLKDGSKATLTTTINYGEKDLKDITSLRKILDDAGDKTRKMTYHIVKNGNIIKTYETEVPYGCYCNPTFSSQVVDSEDKNLYVDKNCKTPVDSDTSDLTKDAVAYIKGK